MSLPCRCSSIDMRKAYCDVVYPLPAACLWVGEGFFYRITKKRDRITKLVPS